MADGESHGLTGPRTILVDMAIAVNSSSQSLSKLHYIVQTLNTNGSPGLLVPVFQSENFLISELHRSFYSHVSRFQG